GDAASPFHRSMRSSWTAARITGASGPYSFASTRELVTTAGVKRMFSSVCSPVYGGSRHGSLKSSGGRGAIPGFWVFGAGTFEVCDTAARAEKARAVVVRTSRPIKRINVARTLFLPKRAL